MGTLVAYGPDVVGIQGEVKKYSTEEHVVGEWIDGSPIYEKTISCGALPNATTKNTPHEISNLKELISLDGVSMSNTTFINLPHTNAINISNCVEVYATLTNIVIRSSADVTAYIKTYITLRYTKTTT